MSAPKPKPQLPDLDDLDALPHPYLAACVAVVRAMRDQCTITDEHADALLAHEETNEGRKRLALGLHAFRVSSDEQTAMAFYQWPLRGA